MLKARTKRNIVNTAPVLAALGDATRLELITRLSDGRSQSIAELTSGMSLTRQGITKHLSVLKEVGIVQSSRVGRENHFIFDPKPIRQVSSYLDGVSSQWDDALSRLKSFVEK